MTLSADPVGTDKLAGWDPTGYLELNDIALWSCEFKREVDYEAIRHPDSSLGVQTRKTCKAEFLEVEDSDGKRAQLLRVLTEFGIRSVAEIEGEDSPDEILYTVEATFSVDFKIGTLPAADDLDRFIRSNCTHIAWPFWRQHVFQTLKAASLPVPQIPLLSPVRKKKKASGNKRAITAERRLAELTDTLQQLSRSREESSPT